MRARYGITQEELADLAGISRSYIGKIETGKRNICWKTVERIAWGFGLTVSQFFAESEALSIAEAEETDDENNITYSIVELKELEPIP